MKKKAMYAKEVIARKNERNCLNQIKDMTKRDVFIPLEMTIPISDPETEWKNSNDI
jgi:hypothetical protein